MTTGQTPSEIAQSLRPARRKALLSWPGRGDYSTASYIELRNLGLIDRNFYLTDLGEQVRDALRLGMGQ